jgi:hypothetical protein
MKNKTGEKKPVGARANLIKTLALAGLSTFAAFAFSGCKKSCDRQPIEGKEYAWYDEKGHCHISELPVNNVKKPAGSVTIEDGKIYASFTVNNIEELMWLYSTDTIEKLFRALHLPQGQGHNILESLDIYATGLRDIPLTTENNNQATLAMQSLINWKNRSETTGKVRIAMPANGLVRPAGQNVRIANPTNFMERSQELAEYWMLAPQSLSAYFATNHLIDTNMMHRFVPDTIVHERVPPVLSWIDEKTMDIPGKTYVLKDFSTITATSETLKKLQAPTAGNICTMPMPVIMDGTEYNQMDAQRFHKFKTAGCAAYPLVVNGPVDMEDVHKIKGMWGVTDFSMTPETSMGMTVGTNYDETYTLYLFNDNTPDIFRAPDGRFVVSIRTIEHARHGTSRKYNRFFISTAVIPNGDYHLYMDDDWFAGWIPPYINPLDIEGTLNTNGPNYGGLKVRMPNMSNVNCITNDTITKWRNQGWTGKSL